MGYQTTLLILKLFIFCLLIGIVSGQDWLEGGYVGSYQGDIGQYFTDPIFFTRVPISQPLGFYEPYNAARFSREPLRLGKLPDRSLPLLFQSRSYLNIYPFNPKQSDFRNRSLSAMQWEPFEKNWTATMSFARDISSLKVLERGSWRGV